jgi:hypothetical protein
MAFLAAGCILKRRKGISTQTEHLIQQNPSKTVNYLYPHGGAIPKFVINGKPVSSYDLDEHSLTYDS